MSLNISNIDRVRLVQAILETGNNLLEIRLSDSDVEYWLANSFEESVFNTTASVDFCMISGMDITPFLESAVGIFQNNNEFNNKLIAYIEKNKAISQKFSKYIKWRYYSLR
jgi:hypothetical protein